jgi:hypothetical protein
LESLFCFVLHRKFENKHHEHSVDGKIFYHLFTQQPPWCGGRLYIILLSRST